MNELQKKAIENLQEKNRKFIIQVDYLKKEITKKYENFNEFEEDFNKLMNKMERAHSKSPFMPYHDAYCFKEFQFRH